MYIIEVAYGVIISLSEFFLYPAFVWQFRPHKVYIAQKVFWWRRYQALQKYTCPAGCNFFELKNSKKTCIFYSNGAPIYNYELWTFNFHKSGGNTKWTVSHFFLILTLIQFNNPFFPITCWKWEKKPILQLSDSINFEQIKSWTVCDTCPSQTGLLLSLNSSKFPFVITCDSQNTCLKRPIINLYEEKAVGFSLYKKLKMTQYSQINPIRHHYLIVIICCMIFFNCDLFCISNLFSLN